MKFFFFFLGLSMLMVSAGCGTATSSSANTTNAANSSAANGMQNVDPRDLPPGLSASPMQPVSNVNAINSSAPGGTPTPGIPDAKTLEKTPRPGATPTPGIPDEETIKRQMEEMRKAMNSNVNQPPPGAGDGQMMRKKPRMTNTNN